MTMLIGKRRDLELSPGRVPGIASGGIAVGAFAVGALAIGDLAIGRLSIRWAEAQKLHLGEVEIDELKVKRLQVIETTSGHAEPKAQDHLDEGAAKATTIALEPQAL